TADSAAATELSWKDVSAGDILSLEVGFQLIPLVDESRGGTLLDRIRGVRRKLTEEFGFLVHPVHVRDNLDLEPGQYKIFVHGILEGDAVIYPDREMALDPGGVTGTIQGIRGEDPAFGMEAIWIEPSHKERALSMGYTVVDASTVVATHLSKVLNNCAGELLGHDEVQHWLDRLAIASPKLAEDLVPKTIAMATLVRVLQNLLNDGVPIKDMRSIAEVLAERAPEQKDAEELTTSVRVALRKLITHSVAGNASTVDVITVDSQLEQIWLQSLNNSDKASGVAGLGMEPGLAERFYRSLAESAQAQRTTGTAAVLLVNPEVRPWIARMVRHSIPSLKVMSYAEIAENRQVRVIANIGNTNALEAESVAA
ncbi:MAG: FHIPEP family type III secretion protein, partial [Pseudomonadota bacterium]